MENRDGQGKLGRFDLSMSRRTRKPAAVAAKASPDRDSEPGKGGGEARRHPCLKDLMKEGGGEEKVDLTAGAAEGQVDQGAASGGSEKQNGGSLPGHKLVQEEKHLPMVRLRGSGGMVTRCAKMLGNLVKTRPGSKKKTVARLLK